MTRLNAPAHAKINLTLHVTGQRDDGYHLLDSLVVFADIADQLTAAPAANLTLTVSGPFAHGVPTDISNLVLRAADTLRLARGVHHGAQITLEKNLPHAAGIGGGSADAAAALSLLAQLWDVAPLPATAPEVLALGADVPACMHGPTPLHMSGIGDVLSPVNGLPACALVLVNPNVAVPTNVAFRDLTSRNNPPMLALPGVVDFDAFALWLNDQRNDLEPPARALAPAIGIALDKLASMTAVSAVGMSGSGATCYGLVRDMATARQIARAIQVAEMGWWVTPAAIL